MSVSGRVSYFSAPTELRSTVLSMACIAPPTASRSGSQLIGLRGQGGQDAVGVGVPWLVVAKDDGADVQLGHPFHAQPGCGQVVAEQRAREGDPAAPDLERVADKEQ